MTSWEFTAELWQWEARSDSWMFVTVPGEIGEDLTVLSGPRRGFGSVRVEVRVGTSVWRTSVFPDKARGYVLPVKKEVRRRHDLEAGDPVTVRISLP